MTRHRRRDVTDRHVDALTLAGTRDEVSAHVIELRRAGIDTVIIRPLAGEGVSVEDTIAAFGEIWPIVMKAAG